MQRFMRLATGGLLLSGLSTGASAEHSRARTEITLLGGASFLDAEVQAVLSRGIGVGDQPRVRPVLRQRRSLGGSFLQGFGVGRYVTRRAAFEASFELAPSHDLRFESRLLCDGGPCPLRDGRPLAPEVSTRDHVTAYRYRLALTFDLLGGDARPYVTAGLGGVSWDLPERNRTDFVFVFGAGARVDFGRRFGARLEVGDHLVPDHFLTGRTEHDVQVRGGLVFRP